MCVLLLTALILGSASCDGGEDDGERGTAAPPGQETEGRAPEVPAEAPPEAPPEPPEPEDLDGMSQNELEALCFSGNQRACDRLGH